MRTFVGHEKSITDLSFSADGRWLLSSSEDGTLRVWDIPSARTLQVRFIFQLIQMPSLQIPKAARGLLEALLATPTFLIP